MTLQFSLVIAGYPGDDINFAWELSSINTALDLGTVTSKVFVGQNPEPVYTGPPVPYTVVKNAGDSDLQHGVIVNPDPNSDNFDPGLWKFLYRLGKKTLRLEVTGTMGTAKGPYTAEADITILPEKVDQTWWQWISLPDPVQNDVRWKTNFDVGGTLTGKGHCSMTPSFVLNELDLQGNSSSSPFKFQGEDLPKGASKNYDIGSLDKNWPWTVDGIWAIIGPLREDFQYTLEFSLTDQFDNKYAAVSSLMAPVRVSVPDYKIASAVFAAHQAVAAAGSAVASIWWPPAAAVAIAQTAVAAIAWGIAKDPPSPDPQYRHEVAVVPHRLPPAFLRDGRLAGMKTILENQNLILACQVALSQIESRLLGAKLASDAEGVTIQRKSYARVVDQMVRLSNDLPQTIGLAEEAIGLIDSSQLAGTVDQWREGGVPSEVRRNLAQAGMSEPDLGHLDQSIRDPIFAANTKLGMGRAMWRSTAALKISVDGIRREMPLKLA
jgi:hypothetical protein